MVSLLCPTPHPGCALTSRSSTSLDHDSASVIGAIAEATPFGYSTARSH